MVMISELTIGQGNIEVEGVIKEVGEPKVFNKFGRELRVADAILEDSSGSIRLSLWNEDINKFKSGDNVKIINGYVNEFQGEKQLTSGKYGKIEKSDGNSISSDSDSSSEDSPESETRNEESSDIENIEEQEF